MKAKFDGLILDRMTGRRAGKTRGYDTWEAAQRAAEKLCNRKYGRRNDRYALRIRYEGRTL